MQGTFHIADPDGHMRDASGFHGSLLSLKGFLCLAAMTWSVAAVHPGIVSLVLLQDRFWGNVLSYFACAIPQYLSGSYPHRSASKWREDSGPPMPFSCGAARACWPASMGPGCRELRAKLGAANKPCG